MTNTPSTRRPDLGALYLQFRERLVRVTMVQLAPFSATDLVDDVIHNVFEGLNERGVPEDVLNWEAYLVTLVKREAIDVGRHEVGHDNRRTHAAAASLNEEHDAFAELEHRLDLDRRLPSLRLALDALSPKEKAVIDGLYRRRLANKDLAAELGMSPGRVSQLSKQAREHLKVLMADSE